MCSKYFFIKFLNVVYQSATDCFSLFRPIAVLFWLLMSSFFMLPLPLLLYLLCFIYVGVIVVVAHIANVPFYFLLFFFPTVLFSPTNDGVNTYIVIDSSSSSLGVNAVLFAFFYFYLCRRYKHVPMYAEIIYSIGLFSSAIFFWILLYF